MNDRENILIEGEHLRLRTMAREDIPRKVAWYNDPQVNQTLVMPEPLELEKSYRWFDRIKDDPTRADWMIETLDGVPIGVSGLKNINANNQSALLFIVIGEKTCWRKGLGLEAECLMIHFGFREMKLHKILTTVLETNAGSLRVCEKVGFVQEGLFRDDYYHDGKYYGVFRYGIFQEEFYGKHPEYGDVRAFPSAG